MNFILIKIFTFIFTKSADVLHLGKMYLHRSLNPHLFCVCYEISLNCMLGRQHDKSNVFIKAGKEEQQVNPAQKEITGFG